MKGVTSEFKIYVDGVYILESFNITEHIHEEYIKDMVCNKETEENVIISGTITSSNGDKNYLIYLDLKEFILRLFSLFGVNVQIISDRIYPPSSRYISGEYKIKPPVIKVKGETILKEVEKIKDSLYNNKRNDEFYNLIESNRDIDMVHRFRSLFSTFDKKAPKYYDGSIKYKPLIKRFIEIIEQRYSDWDFVRYQEIIDELIKSDIKDLKAKKEYSKELKKSFSSMDKSVIIDRNVAFNILKCIQNLRNKINHGTFGKITPKAVMGSYELLLSLTQELMRSN